VALLLAILAAASYGAAAAKTRVQVCPQNPLCLCKAGKVHACHESVKPLPKGALKIGATEHFCDDVILNAMAAIRKGGCAAADVAHVCLARALIKNQHCRGPAGAVNKASWKCSCAGSVCPHLAKARTARLGAYIPDSIHPALKCQKPSLKETADVKAAATGSMLLGATNCDSYAALVNRALSTVVPATWALVANNIPDSIPLSIAVKGTPVDKNLDLWVKTIKLAFLQYQVGLDSIGGLSTLTTPYVEISGIDDCTDLSSISAQVVVEVGINSLTASGDGWAQFYTDFGINLRPSLGVTASVSAKVAIQLTVSASLKGTQVCFFANSVDSVEVMLGTPNVNIGGLDSGAVLDAINSLDSDLYNLIVGQIQGLMSGPATDAASGAINSAVSSNLGVMHACQSF